MSCIQSHASMSSVVLLELTKLLIVIVTRLGKKREILARLQNKVVSVFLQPALSNHKGHNAVTCHVVLSVIMHTPYMNPTSLYSIK